MNTACCFIKAYIHCIYNDTSAKIMQVTEWGCRDGMHHAIPFSNTIKDTSTRGVGSRGAPGAGAPPLFRLIVHTSINQKVLQWQYY